VVAQGSDWHTAKVAAFYSAKLNPAQCNYPVHEQEMLVGVETILRHKTFYRAQSSSGLWTTKG
jgi:hypothetical protein